MRNDFHVAIATRLESTDICGKKAFPHECVLDLRKNNCGGMRAIDEVTLKRLRNYFVSYNQSAVNIDDLTTREEQTLYKLIVSEGEDILILTDHVAAVAGFCQKFNLPFYSKELYLVETGKGNIPVQIPNQSTGYTAQFGTFVG